MAEPAWLPEHCEACQNQFQLLPLPNRDQRHCPYCGSTVWPQQPASRLETLGPFSRIRKTDWRLGRSWFYEAWKDNRRLLITLLDPGEASLCSFREPDPATTIALDHEPIPETLNRYQTVVLDRTTIVPFDYFEGQTLRSVFPKRQSLDVCDVVHMMIKCLRACDYWKTFLDSYRSMFSFTDLMIIQPNGQVTLLPVWDWVSDQLWTDPTRSLENSLNGPFPCRFLPATRSLTWEQLTGRCWALQTLGTFFFQLLTDEPYRPRPSRHGDSPQKVAEDALARSRVPSRLSSIVLQLLTATSDSDLSYRDLLKKLELLGIDSPSLFFVTETPLQKKSEPESVMQRGWLSMDPEVDFRNMKWGMTKSQVKATESTLPCQDFPANTIYSILFDSLQLQLIYHYFPNPEDEDTCLMVSLSHTQISTPRPDAHSIVSQSHQRRVESMEKQKQYRREGMHEEALNVQKKYLGSLQEDHAIDHHIADIARLTDPFNHPHDVERIELNYHKFLQMLSLMYGTPERWADGYRLLLENTMPPLDRKVVDRIYQSCQPVQWVTERTVAVLGISLMPGGLYNIISQIRSRKDSERLPSMIDGDDSSL